MNQSDIYVKIHHHSSHSGQIAYRRRWLNGDPVLVYSVW